MPDIIAQTELDALLDATGAAARRTRRPPTGVTLYDFRHPTALSASEIQALRERFRSLAAMLSRLISAYLGHPMRLALHSLDICTQAQYAQALAQPSVLAVVAFGPPPTRVYWELSPGLAEVVLDCMLGGSGHSAGEGSGGLGPVSRGVLACLYREVLSAWVELWPGLQESPPRLTHVQDMPPDLDDGTATERIVQAVLNGECCGREGPLRLVLPLAMARPVLRQMTGHRAAPAPVSGTEPPQVGMSDTRVALAAALDGPAVPVEQLLRLRPGEMLDLRLPADSPCVVTVGGRPKFVGVLGTSRAQRAVELRRVLRDAEDR